MENDDDKIIPIINMSFRKWLNKFENTLDNRELVFDEESCKKESILAAEELKSIIGKYIENENSDGK